MYEERATTKQMIITAAAVLGAIGLVFVVGGMLLGSLFAIPASPNPATLETAVSPVATTAAVPKSKPITEPVVAEPAPVAPVAAPDPVQPVAAGVVCIDAGHQAQGDSSLEPVGPGASEKKPKVAGGATGTATRNPESLINLQVAERLRDELEKRGVTVVMVRTEQDVNISNSERAAVANNAKADLFVRLHCDGNGSSSLAGLSTLVPGTNQWTAPIIAASAQAGQLVHKAVIRSTGASDRGVVPRSDLAGFNWSKVPTVLVEMGFMSNAAEDKKLGTAEYQQKLAMGMADGIVEYLKTD